LAYKNAFKSLLSDNEAYSGKTDAEIDVIATVNAQNVDSYIKEAEKSMGIGDKKFWTLNGANDKEIEEWALKNNYTYKYGKVYDANGIEIDTSDNE
jgi:hypothetical protein